MVKKNHDIITLELHLKNETEKAYLVSDGKTTAWIPKSQCEMAEGLGVACEFQMPEWLAVEKGLV